MNDQLYADLLENFGLSQCNVTLLGLGKLAIHNEKLDSIAVLIQRLV